MEKTELSYIADGNVIWYRDFGKLTVSLEVKHMPDMTQTFPCQVFIQCLHDTVPQTYTADIYSHSVRPEVKIRVLAGL